MYRLVMREKLGKIEILNSVSELLTLTPSTISTQLPRSVTTAATFLANSEDWMSKHLQLETSAKRSWLLPHFDGRVAKVCVVTSPF